jgi:hypothetical protein
VPFSGNTSGSTGVYSRGMRLHGVPKSTLSLLACLLLTVACGSGTISRSSAAAADPREDLARAMKAVNAARSYRKKTVVTVSGKTVEGKSVLEVEFSAPGRWHSLFESNLPPYNNQKVEWFIVGGKSYERVAGGPWHKVPEKRTELFRPPDEVGPDTKMVELIGEEVLNGARMLVYRHTFEGTSDGEGEGAYTLSKYKGVAQIWVGVNDGLPHKIEKETESEYRQAETIKARDTTTYYDYNADIRIEPPR